MSRKPRDQVRIGVLSAVLLYLSALTLPAYAQADTDPVDAWENDTWENYYVPVETGELDRILDAYTSDDGLQKERPVFVPEPRPEREVRERGERNRFLESIGNFFADLFNGIGGGFGYVLLAIIAAGILYAAYLMFGDSFTLRGREKTKDDAPEVSTAPNLRPEEEAATALLEDADALAAQGRFAEAVHLLLFRSIGDLQAKLEGGVPRSLTAREIGMLTRLPDAVRRALSPIIAIVERSFFGGRDVDEAGWKEARASYQDFAFGEGWA